MRLEDHFRNSSTVQRNERVRLAASFWNNGSAYDLLGFCGRLQHTAQNLSSKESGASV